MTNIFDLFRDTKARHDREKALRRLVETRGVCRGGGIDRCKNCTTRADTTRSMYDCSISEVEKRARAILKREYKVDI